MYNTRYISTSIENSLENHIHLDKWVVWWNMKTSKNLKNNSPTQVLMGLQNQDKKPIDPDDYHYIECILMRKIWPPCSLKDNSWA